MKLEEKICREAISKAERLFKSNLQCFKLRDAFHEKTGTLVVKIDGFELEITRYSYYKVVVYFAKGDGRPVLLYVLPPRLFKWWHAFSLYHRVKLLFDKVETMTQRHGNDSGRLEELRRRLKEIRAIQLEREWNQYNEYQACNIANAQVARYFILLGTSFNIDMTGNGKN